MKIFGILSHYYKQPPPINIVNVSGIFRPCMCWLLAILSEHNVLIASSMAHDIAKEDKEGNRANSNKYEWKVQKSLSSFSIHSATRFFSLLYLFFYILLSLPSRFKVF